MFISILYFCIAAQQLTFYKVTHNVHLIRAPVPDSPYCHPKHHPRPGEVPCGRVPQQVEGILPGGVARRGDVVILGIQRGGVFWHRG